MENSLEKLRQPFEKSLNAVSEEYKGILKEYRDDMVKYAPDKDKPHIRECFNSIPKQLAKENKKFQWSKVKPGGRGETYMGSIQWLDGVLGPRSRQHNGCLRAGGLPKPEFIKAPWITRIIFRFKTPLTPYLSGNPSNIPSIEGLNEGINEGLNGLICFSFLLLPEITLA